jgi:quinol-cytochrome oxidoreductase complex cytochrome b subunit
VLVVWPFLDRSPEVLARRRKVVVGGATLVMVALVALTVRGYVADPTGMPADPARPRTAARRGARLAAGRSPRA